VWRLERQPRSASHIEALIDERIRSRKPAAYLTGEAWLQGVPFMWTSA
jgi:ribosomal protein L3 glutamine methyltransferase